MTTDQTLREFLVHTCGVTTWTPTHQAWGRELVTFCQAQGMRFDKVFDPFFWPRVNVYPAAVLQAFFRDKGIAPARRTGRRRYEPATQKDRGEARMGGARHGSRRGLPRLGQAMRGRARSMAGQVQARLGQARRGVDRGRARQCKAGLCRARITARI